MTVSWVGVTARSVPPDERAAASRTGMMRAMVEEGVDAFIARFKAYASDVQVAARYEGSPLLECFAGDLVVHLFERTNPYHAGTGRARVIIQPEAASCVRLEPDDPAPARSAESVALSALAVTGVVALRDDPFLVVDAGIRLVVAFDALPSEVAVGDRVRFQSRPPIHGFVLPPERGGGYVATDDMV